MSSQGSVTAWIDQLRAGDRAAAQPLWQGYFQRLVGLAAPPALARGDAGWGGLPEWLGS